MIRRLRGLGRDDTGLSLVEMMVALTIFAIITVGITPLIASALKGVGLSRSYTIGKTLATTTMEKMRGLPYFESSQGQPTPQRLDLLDLYFPDRNSGFRATDDTSTPSVNEANTFTTTCTPTASTPAANGSSACIGNIPTGHTVTIVTAFVSPGPSGPPQTFTVVPPPAGYTWTTAAEPPAKLLRATVTVSWTFGDQARTFSLSSILGQRQLSKQTVDGNASVDYGVQVLASYVDSQGRKSNIVVTGGQADAEIAAGVAGKATETTSAAQLLLTQEETAIDPAVTLANLAGASSAVTAPPNAYPAPGASATEQTVSYQVSAAQTIPVAFADDTLVEGPSPFSLGAQVVGSLPKAAGRFRFSGPAGAGQPTMWVDNQAQRGLLSPLQLSDTAHLAIVEKDGATPRLNGQATAEVAAQSPPASRKVETKASTGMAKLSLFPTTYITDLENAVLVVDNFTASLACTSTANVSTAAVTGTWSATLRYWRDANPADGIAAGSYSAPVTLSGSTTGGTDPMAAVKSTNPLVYDHPLDANDVYLFGGGGRKGYFTDIRTNPLISSVVGSGGRSTFGSIKGAIEIETVPTSQTNPATAMSVSVGSLACSAVDRRGL